MPDLFLSPSLQPWNPYINGGNEAQYMGYVADALEPYLLENNISYTRSRMPNTLANAINTSNSGSYALHLALHSNASGAGSEGRYRGIQAYYYPTSTKGRQAAEDLVEALREIYPDPELVYTVPTTTIQEVRRTKAPAVLMEIGYHDNLQDAKWIKDNIQAIALQLAKGLTKFFNLPFKDVCTSTVNKLINVPDPRLNAYVRICTSEGGGLNLRSEPNTSADVLTVIANNDKALLLEKQCDWARIRYNAIEGYTSGNFLCTCKSSGTVGRVNTQGGNLNLRSEPSLNGRILGRIPDNASVNILSAEGGWYKVEYMGVAGYVLSEFVVI